MTILSARKYRSPRYGWLSLEQRETRRLAYAIKDTRSPAADFALAGAEMAALITGPCWLIPVPSATGSTDANAMLAHAIARHTPGARIARALTRTRPVQSQCERHRAGLGPTAPDGHFIARTRKYLDLMQTYFVDNVTTSGNTLLACRLALGHGAGLVFADAANRHTQIQATLDL